MTTPPTSDADTTTFSPGFPVEIGRIEKELARLWEESGDTKTRASLINLAIYTESPASLSANTGLIAEIASEHACRAILIVADPANPEPGVRAWISAHCHLSGKGERQICSEQITFQLDGDLTDALPNVVFSHVDSDLPLCFWWQAPFTDSIDAKLWTWVDRLIYDSQTWTHPAAQLPLVRHIAERADARTVLCDLNWARLLTSRFALANLFDHTAALRALRQIQTVEITHAPGARTTAILLLGWLAAQLGWSLDSVLSRHAFRDSNHSEISFDLREAPGACISACRFTAGDTTIQLTREPSAEFFHADISVAGTPSIGMRLPAGKDGIRDTLLMELGRGGVHPLYHKSLAVIAPLLEA